MNMTITDHFYQSRERNSRLQAMKFKKNSVWHSISWADYFQTSEKIGAALLSLGVKKGDRVAILANSSHKWALTDTSILCVGALTIPIYQSYRPEEIEYILNDSESTIVFCENDDQVIKWLEVKEKCPKVKTVIAFDLSKDMTGSGLTTWNQLLEMGEKHLLDHPDCFAEACQSNQLEQDATILYTSGTTGEPKGVVLRHQQIMSEINDAFLLLYVNTQDRSLSFLPYAHILGRIEVWGNILAGYTLCFAESIEKIAQNLQEVRPTFMISVPRIFEKIYNGVLAQAETSPTKYKVFSWAVDTGRKVSQHKRDCTPIPIALLAQYQLAKKLVFSKLIEKLGGKMRFAVSGGAPLSKEIGEFFHAADFLILEGYGLTETTAAVTLNTPLEYEFGTVGKPFGDVEIEFAEDGEILVKSNKVMKEYYKKPEATAEVFQGGYFATGDIGELTEKGFVKITDRKKDLIKTAGGKYVAPQKLEGLLKLNKYVSQVLIHGDKRKYIVALVTLDQPSVESFALENQISFQDVSSLAQNPKVQQLIRDAIAETNTHLSSYETIKNFHVLGHDFTQEAGELTPSLKVKRKYCDQKYKEIIDGLYGVDRGSL